jgi:hypothetical protein
MDELPMASAGCSLDQAGLGEQLSRYGRAGIGAHVLRDSPQELVLALAASVADDEIEELVAVERSCCPFFRIDWAPERRILSIRVSNTLEAPALAAIKHAVFARAPAPPETRAV